LTWIAAQDLRAIFDCRSRYAAEQHLHRWLTHCAEHDVPELRRLACTIDVWREELLAYFDTGGVSNGPTEAMNSLIKKVKRHGFRNLDNYRLRLLLQHICFIAHLDRWLSAEQLSVGDLNAAAVQQYLSERRAAGT